jgi:hypothetical protein
MAEVVNPTTVGLSPKAVGATAVVTVLSIVIAVLNGLTENPDLIPGIPPWLQAILLIAVPPLVVGFVAYRAAVGVVALPGSGPVEPGAGGDPIA